MSPGSKVDAFVPLKPVVLHILLVLADGRAHGYEIMQTAEQRSDGAVDISTAVLYRTLSRLLKQGLVAESESRPARHDDSRRRYYQLTPLGRKVLAIELRRLRAILASQPASGILRTADGL